MKLIKYTNSFIIEMTFIIAMLLAVTNVRADQFSFEDYYNIENLNEYYFSILKNNDILDNDWFYEFEEGGKRFRECRRYDTYKNIFNIPIPFNPKPNFC
ncbi:hypothetical protein OA527_01160 [Pelagibacteraceae bacterium]|nr:hypothetical protein [Pelagibacteraceae bacterium]